LSVADVDAEQVFRCGFRLGQVAEDVRTAADRTACCYPDDWHGDAGIAYQMRLDQTAERIRRMSAAYDAASAALLPYARAVLEAQEIWRRSESLLAEAETAEQEAAAAAAAQGVASLIGPSPAEGFRAAAYRLQADAEDIEHRAAVVCGANLDDEAARAPAVGTWRKVDRFLGDVAGFGVETVTGTAAVAGLAWHALPGVGSRHSRHEARDDLVEAGKGAVLSIWNLPTDIRDDVKDGRPGLALSAAMGVVGPGKLSKVVRHPLHHLSVEHEALEQADRQAYLASQPKWRQSAKEMAENGVDLKNEEARGGHTWKKHIARSEPYLRRRLAKGYEKAGSFLDFDDAQALVNETLRVKADDIPKAYALQGRELLPLLLELPSDRITGWVAVAGSGDVVPAHKVLVMLKLDEDGEPFVYTAYPEL
jgi:uncharacterized protein YukE